MRKSVEGRVGAGAGVCGAYRAGRDHGGAVARPGAGDRKRFRRRPPAGWLDECTPASYMDTFEGQQLVGAVLAMAQSGAYA